MKKWLCDKAPYFHGWWLDPKAQVGRGNICFVKVFVLICNLILLQAPGLQFDQNGLPVLPGSPEACSVM